MNRIYQGRVSNVEIPTILSASNGERKKGAVSKQAEWQPLPNWQETLWQHHALFQDAVNYYLVCLLALARPGNPLWPIREKLDAHDEADQPDELMVWRPFRRRGALRPGLRDSVAKYLTPGNNQPTPEECFAAVLAWNARSQFN